MRVVWIMLAAVFALSACENTLRGAGQDIEQTGDAVEQTTDNMTN